MKNVHRMNVVNIFVSQKLALETGQFSFGRMLPSLLIGLFIFFLLPVILFAAETSVGVYYFPGWKNTEGAWWNPPWEKIKLYPDREPLLGYYPEGETSVSEKHVEWMYNAGIKFVVYDWYWANDNTVYLEHALQAYMKSKNKDLVHFSILWANHTPVPENLKQFELMVNYWITNYFTQKQFLQLDGKPVVFIFAPERLRDNAANFGKTTKELLDLARSAALKAGFKGIYFVACTQANEYWVKDHIPKSGYDAVTAYNYHRGYSGKYEAGGEAKSYLELAQGYKQSWAWILSNSYLPYFIPVISGWSKKPWGSNTPHDECISDPEMFKQHLIDAKTMIDRYPEKTKKTVLICCWNEFAEGSYIEPTKKYNLKYLETVKEVFTE